MKKLIKGALLGMLLVTVLLMVARTSGAPILTYVYSNSMEPLIKVNDAFFVWPEKDYAVGDIIMFRPVVLDAEYITHRITDIGTNGYITKGDNTPYYDQESGEPEVWKDRIVGRVVTINQQPLIIPGLGNLSEVIRPFLGQYARYFSYVFFIIGISALFIRGKHSIRKRKPTRRLRLRHIYKGIMIASIVIVVASVSMGSRVNQIKYLVSEYPGTLGDQIMVGQPGTLTMYVKNHGIVPVWSVFTGVEPLSIKEAPNYIGPRSEELITLHVLPQRDTGFYYGYVQIYHYPILFPRNILLYLHGIHPAISVIATGFVFGFYVWIFLRLINHIPGLHGFIPLRAIKDKISDRRLKRTKAKLLGRRRIR